VHPLSAAGQDLEKEAVAKLTMPLAMDYLRQLVLEPTRSYTNAQESQKAEHFLSNAFQKMGLSVCFHNFTSDDVKGGPQLTNVVAFIPGSTAETVVLGAHYDSRPFDGKAPGAEDNGSGTAALLAVAHAFMAAGIKPKASVYFVGFAAEEPGLIGSKAFADSLRDGFNGFPNGCKPQSSFLLKRSGANPSRHKAIIMDEIGWASPDLKTPTVNLESYDWCKDVMDHLRESSQVHNGDKLAVVHSNNPFGSDHMSFLDNQMSAVLTINGFDEAYPNYHRSSDTIDNVNQALLTMISKMNLGALIRIAGAH
jgi:Zn-dependent M28 family amino/carboxypeptidase